MTSAPTTSTRSEKAKARWAAMTPEERAARGREVSDGLRRRYVAVPQWAEPWRETYLEIASYEDEFAAARYVRALKREGR